MDRLNKVEIEHSLSALLADCKVECTLNADGTASLMVEGPQGEVFAVTGLVRSTYHGQSGLKRLAEQIFEDIELARQGLLPQRALPHHSEADLEIKIVL
ncbi:MAG TPA: hypothetical protein VGC62_03865 [Pseudomonas sp.]|uniref:hypothetical protein n=1 Tax=Pseudomonas sp. TaxID=306 RepID=UPI002EDB65EC